MDLYEAIRSRYSVRSYLPDAIAEESLTRILEAARLAPSSSNRQEWRFIVVRDAARRSSLAEAANNQLWMATAPVIIAAVATEPLSVTTCGVPRYAVDVSIAVSHMMLAAVAEGIGTCWIGAFSQERVRDILQVEPGCVVLTIMPFGYPRDAQRPQRMRKPLGSIVRHETDSR